MTPDETMRWDAIAYVLRLREKWHAAIPASELKQFVSGGTPIFLKGQQGIFKPKEMSLPLSIRSALDSPYTDTLIDGRRILYDFAPSTREHENDGLKRCAELSLPLIYLLQLKRKPNPEYQIFAPVIVTNWDDATKQFTVDLQPQLEALLEPVSVESDLVADASLPEAIAKAYATKTVERRMHQAKFREKVLTAYRERCSVCVLRVRPLLDAAHIVSDRDPKPTLVVNEGLSLCATHHRAFDAEILRYDERFRIEIDLPERTRIGEGERRMLLHYRGTQLHLPKDESLWPVIRD